MMSGSQKSVGIIGILLAVLPFLGFPQTVESFFVVLGGVTVSTTVLLTSRKRKTMSEQILSEVKSIASQVFVENRPTVH